MKMSVKDHISRLHCLSSERKFVFYMEVPKTKKINIYIFYLILFSSLKQKPFSTHTNKPFRVTLVPLYHFNKTRLETIGKHTRKYRVVLEGCTRLQATESTAELSITNG